MNDTNPAPPSRARTIATIARTDTTRLLRDPVALFFIIVLPIVIMLLIGATFGSNSSHMPLGVVDHDNSPSSQALVRALRASGVLEVKEYDDETALRQDIRVQSVAGGVAIPAGYSADLDRGATVTTTLLADEKQQATVTLQRVLNDVLDHEGQAIAAARFAATQAGGDATPQLEQARAIQARIDQIDVAVETTGRATLDSTNRYSYTAPSNLVLFVFINSITGATALVESRQLGITRRTLAAPVRVGTIVLGAGASRFLIAMLQSLLILLIGTFAFGVTWGDPLGAGALVVVFALLATGAGLLVGAIARKPDQVAPIGIPVSMGFAMLGGCMWPLEIVSPTLQTVGHLTPHAWAMDAWITLSFEGGGITAIAANLAVLGSIALALLGLAVWRLRRSLIA